MIKLIKQNENEIFYWEVWEDRKILTIHYGLVGEKGETEEIKLSLFQKAEKIMETLAKEKINVGYEYLDEDELTELVIQHPYKEEKMEQALERRNIVEDLMNECLGWTGNGFSDGGDIGSGTANVFNYVIDVEEALKVIIEELSNNNLLENVKIAYLNDEEEYVSLYPKDTDFDII